MSVEVASSLYHGALRMILMYPKGDVVSVEIPGLSLVILNSYEAAQELLGKRPNTTSARKIGYMTRQV